MENDKKRNIFERHPLITFGVGYTVLAILYIRSTFKLTDWTIEKYAECETLAKITDNYEE